jgi:hypothetical protein
LALVEVVTEERVVMEQLSATVVQEVAVVAVVVMVPLAGLAEFS